jgi:CIC family chloride channel protein
MPEKTRVDWAHRPFPPALRAFVRARSIGIVLVALLIGAVAAILVVALNEAAQAAHEFLFDLRRGEHLSASAPLDWRRVLIVLPFGGALLAAVSLAAGTRFADRVADAIEANALRGGRMSIGGSLYIVLQTLISNGCGASVGLEAAYTQICSAFASWLSNGLSARRADSRLLVGCGAAAAIAAAFNAPLAGAFYGFEVVLGAYSVGSLAPVVTASVTATLIANGINGAGTLDIAIGVSRPLATTIAHAAILATMAAILGIVVMKGVAAVEAALTRVRVRALARPVIGGFVVAGLAMVSPEVMGSGHGALQASQLQSRPLEALALLVALKCAASAVSLGSGFRGGLFFASLLIGGTLGRFYADAVNLHTTLNIDAGTAAVAGVAAFGAGVLGAPVTMTVLALEMTGDFYVAVAALVAATIANFIVREAFGYSFATWRFHLRGETIRGPADIGWMRDLTVERLMRKSTPTAPRGLTIEEARGRFAPGAEKQFFLVDEAGRFDGVVLTGELHASEEPLDSPVSALARARDGALTPDMNVREALRAFEEREIDVLAVVDSLDTRVVAGLLTEAHALKRYGEELERRHRAVVDI